MDDPIDHALAARVARTHWWYRGRRKILARLLRDLDPPLPPSARVLEVGCGPGTNAAALQRETGYLVGVDASPLALRLATHAPPEARFDAGVCGDVTRLPFADESFDLALALDVIEHVDDDAAATRELVRVLRPGAVAVIFVPALRVLWGPMDDIAEHRRRYARRELVSVATDAGLSVLRATYFNSLLFPPILLSRLAMRGARYTPTRSELAMGGPVTNAVLSAVFSLEAPLVGKLDLPVGVSCACVARKPTR
jgi:SAM-dependent methyltransferase